mgnify:FL=1
MSESWRVGSSAPACTRTRPCAATGPFWLIRCDTGPLRFRLADNYETRRCGYAAAYEVSWRDARLAAFWTCDEGRGLIDGSPSYENDANPARIQG